VGNLRPTTGKRCMYRRVPCLPMPDLFPASTVSVEHLLLTKELVATLPSWEQVEPVPKEQLGRGQ